MYDTAWNKGLLLVAAAGNAGLQMNEQIWNLLASTVDNLGVPGWALFFGYGRVNALAAAAAMVPPPVVPKRGI
jgi:hypothetical protein